MKKLLCLIALSIQANPAKAEPWGDALLFLPAMALCLWDDPVVCRNSEGHFYAEVRHGGEVASVRGGGIGRFSNRLGGMALEMGLEFSHRPGFDTLGTVVGYCLLHDFAIKPCLEGGSTFGLGRVDGAWLSGFGYSVGGALRASVTGDVDLVVNARSISLKTGGEHQLDLGSVEVGAAWHFAPQRRGVRP